MDNSILFPKSGQSAKQFLTNKRGLFVLLNVRSEGKQTSVVINIESHGVATWRWIDRKNKGAAALNLDWPGFDLTKETIVIPEAALNELAASDPAIHALCVGGGENAPADFQLASVAMAPAHMDELLKRLEANSEVLRRAAGNPKPVTAK